MSDPTVLAYDLPSDQVTGTWSSDGTVNALYQLTNIDDGKPWNPVVFTVNPTYLLFDKGSAKRTDIVGLIHWGLDAGAVIRVQENATNIWTSPTMNHEFTAAGPAEDGMPANPFSDRTAVSGYTTTGLRWLRILIVSGQASLLSIGMVRVSSHKRTFSDATTTVRDRNYGAIDREHHPLIERRTDADSQLGYSRGTRARWVSGTIRYDADGFVELRSLLRASRGRSLPFYVIPDPDTNEMVWVKWGTGADTALERNYTDLDVNDVHVDFEEVGRGLAP